MGDQPARRINTVNPIMTDQRMLAHLMQEMTVERGEKENEIKLKAMLEKYQQEVTGVVRGGTDLGDLGPALPSSLQLLQQQQLQQLQQGGIQLPPPPPTSGWIQTGSQGMNGTSNGHSSLHSSHSIVLPPPSLGHSASSHSQPCLASTAMEQQGSGSGSGWTSSTTAVEKKRLAYTRGRSTEQSCLAGSTDGAMISSLHGLPSYSTPVSSAAPSYCTPTTTCPPPPPPPTSLPPPTSGHAPHSSAPSYSHQSHQYVPLGAAASNSLQQAVQAMRAENIFLRAEVERLNAKGTALQRLESEHALIENEYEFLRAEKERMEEMEKMAIGAYEMKIKGLEQERDSLREQLQQSQNAHHLITAAAARIEEYNKLSAFVAGLSRQKDELSMVAERQRREIDSQTTTLEEQRKHIAVLETALGKAQERVQMSDKMIEEFRSEQRLNASNGNGGSNGNVIRRSSSKNSSPSTTPSSEGGGNSEMIAMLKWQVKSKEDVIFKLESTLNEYQKRADEMERLKSAMAQTFNEKIDGLQREKYERDRKIAELTETKERLIAEFQLDGIELNGEDDSRRRDMNKMEEVRQKIQEKKKRVTKTQTKNVRSLTSWSSTTQLTPSTSTAESLPCLPTTVTQSTTVLRPAPPPPTTVIPTVSYTFAPPPPPPTQQQLQQLQQHNNYTAAEYSNARGGGVTTTTTVMSNGSTVITKEADL